MPRHTRQRRSPSTLPFVAVDRATTEILTVHLDAHERPTVLILECEGPPELLAKVRVRRFELMLKPPG